MSQPPSRSHLFPWVVGALVLLAHVAMVRDVAGPVVYADELGYIAAARYFAPGQPDVQMLSSFYHFGYGLLLAPLAALVDEPGPFYRAATLFNAGLATAATFLFHRVVLLRHFLVEPRLAALAALGFGLAPSLLVNTSIVWAETALVLALTIMVATLPWLFARPTLVRAVVVGLAAASSYAIHPRAIVPAFAVAMVLVAGGWIGKVRWPIVAVGMAVELAALIVVRAINNTLRAAIYTEGSVLQTAGGLGESIVGSPGQWLAGLAGTFWYQLLGSAGLAGFGLLLLARSFFDVSGWRRRAGDGGPADDDRLEAVPNQAADRRWPAVAFLLLALFGSWLVGGVISVSDQPRIDQFFYGRYLDAFAPLIIGLGVVEIARRQRVWVASSIPIILVATGWLIRLRGEDDFFTTANVVRVNVPVANAFERVVDTWDPFTLGLLAAGWSLLVLVGSRWRPQLGVVCLVLGSLVVAEVTLSQTIRPASHAGEARSALAGPTELAAEGGTVFLAAPYEFWTLNGLQFWADDVQFALETQCATTATDVVIAAAEDPRLATWTRVAVDEELGRGLFQESAGPWSGSRSVDIAVVDVSTADGLVTAVLDIGNLDDERPLVIGEVLVLFARWSVAGEVIEDTPVDLLGAFSIEPSTDGRQLLEFEAPIAVRGQSVDVAFDLRDPKRGWLSECDQSTFGTVPLTVD